MICFYDNCTSNTTTKDYRAIQQRTYVLFYWKQLSRIFLDMIKISIYYTCAHTPCHENTLWMLYIDTWIFNKLVISNTQ